MRASRDRPTAVALLALLAAGACAGAHGGSQPGPPAPAGASVSAGSSAPAAPAFAPSAAKIEALYRARSDSARMHFTSADVHFMTGMIGHHVQALVMAGWAPMHGASPSLRTLCARIINAQKDEIATMQQWLRDRGQPAPEVMVMDGMPMVHGDMMPGMLTPEQLLQLDQARGPDFDRLFLTDMIQHHRGAVTMVNDLLGTDGAARDELVFKLASDIQVDQTTEIARMERMLSALPSPAGAP
jgi:uncharacterized protein (DUF305 family)